MAPGIQDPRMTAIHPRIRYNTIGGVNGPLVILENVRLSPYHDAGAQDIDSFAIGQIPSVQ